MTLVYEDLQPHHFLDWGCEFVPKHFAGFAERRDGQITAIGFIWHHEGRAWAMFGSLGQHSQAIHKRAIELFSGAAAGGVTELYAGLDESKPNARRWLERLGFEETDEKREEEGVWKLVLDSGRFRFGERGAVGAHARCG